MKMKTMMSYAEKAKSGLKVIHKKKALKSASVLKRLLRVKKKKKKKKKKKSKEEEERKRRKRKRSLC